MNVAIDILRGELERLFTLEDLTKYSATLLGLDPHEVGGDTAKASFARALAERCVEGDRVEALVDVMLFARKNVDPRVFDAVAQLGKEQLTAGKPFGDFVVKRVASESELAFEAECERGGKRYVVKLLKRVAMADRRAVHRFLTANRMVAAMNHAGLPRGLETGEVSGSAFVAYEAIEAETLSARLARTGPQQMTELLPLLRGILEPLASLHEAGLAHGDLKLDHVLVTRSGGVVLVDFGGDKLRRATSGGSSSSDAKASNSFGALAPERVRGKAADARSDAYAFGAMLWELMTGKPMFVATSAADAAFAHLKQDPGVPSSQAPRGWISEELDAFVKPLIDKDSSRRPKDAKALLQLLDGLVHKPKATAMDSAKFEALAQALHAAPSSMLAAQKVERALEEGAEPASVAEALMHASTLITGDSEEDTDAKKSLLYGAARSFGALKDKTRAEEAYAAILALEPGDDVARMALEDIRKQLGKYDELVEMLLERSQSATAPEVRADAFAEIGRIYAHEVEDPEQAVVAYTQALCEMPSRSSYASDVERLCGDHQDRWNDTLQTMTATVQEGGAQDRTQLLLYVAKWYEAKVGRSDLALMAYQQVLQSEPSREEALEGLAAIYRKAQQWPELMAILLSRADAAAVSPKARDYRVEAAELLETRLNDPARAREVYERVLAEDPGHVRASDASARILEKLGDFPALVAVLERRAEARRGAEKAEALSKVAEVYEDHLSDLGEATKRFEAALSVDPRNLTALKGLDRIYNRTGKYRELLDTLDRQVSVAATPRQKITLFERMAGLHDEEFLDHEQAAAALERIISLEPSNDNALSGLTRHYRALDKWDRVVNVLERHAHVSTDENRKVDLLVARGRVLADQIGSPERAMKVYEEVLQLRPGNAGALEALAQLREVSGDSHAALSAIEAIAAKAETPAAKSEQWVRAGRLLESRGDRDAAIERYKMAIELNPRDVAAGSALRKAYTDRGDGAAVVMLIERELEFADGNLAKARLFAELARVQSGEMNEPTRAEASAKRAIDLDGSNADASLVLGNLAFEAGRYLEACKYFETLVSRAQVFEKETAKKMLVRYIEAFGRSNTRTAMPSQSDLGSMPPPSVSSFPAQTSSKLVQALDALQLVAGQDTHALALAASVIFEHGDPKLVFGIYSNLFKTHDATLHGVERAEALYHLGESARRSGELEQAAKSLKDASKIDPTNGKVLRSLARLYETTGDFEEAVRMRKTRLAVCAPEERFDLLLEMGDLEFQKLNDRTRAQKTYAKALEERPDDRKLLTKLMQLYSEDKDWAKLVDVVSKLGDFVEDPKQRSKYMHTAATIAARHLGQNEKATEYYEKAMEFDPANDKAASEAIEIYRAKSDHASVERLLNLRLDAAKDSGDNTRIAGVLDELGELFSKFMNDAEAAIDAYEAGAAFDPNNAARNERLATLYASDPKQHLDKAVKSQMHLLRSNPYRVESYKLLRRLFTDAKAADPAWCLCQILSVLNLADADEHRYYEKHRSENAAAAQAVVTEEDWRLLVHPDLDATLTRIFTIIEPVVVQSRTQALEASGYDARYALDTSRHPYPMSQTLYYAAGVLNMHSTKVFQNPQDPGALGFVHAHEPSIVLGQGAFDTQATTQTLAFLVGRHLTYFRSGFYVRHLIPTGTGLKAWLFAAIKLCVPSFPIAPDLQASVADAMQPMAALLNQAAREQLTSTVSKLLQSGGAIDLKKWVAAVDFSADRVGMLLSHDLQTVTETIRSADQDVAVPVKERMKELVLFSASQEYFELRKKLGIAIDS
jgi:tetratricopeptide (TPR) repeat protein